MVDHFCFGIAPQGPLLHPEFSPQLNVPLVRSPSCCGGQIFVSVSKFRSQQLFLKYTGLIIIIMEKIYCISCTCNCFHLKKNCQLIPKKKYPTPNILCPRIQNILQCHPLKFMSPDPTPKNFFHTNHNFC